MCLNPGNNSEDVKGMMGSKKVVELMDCRFWWGQSNARVVESEWTGRTGGSDQKMRF